MLTDRAFLAEPRTMLWAFMLGGLIAGAFIVLFGLLGVFGAAQATTHPSRHVPVLLLLKVLGNIPALCTGSVYWLGTSQGLAAA